MGSKWLIVLAGVCGSLVLGGCLGDDSGEDTTSEGETYALEVERISDDLDRGGGKALAALNRLADGNADRAEVANLLDRLARDAEDSKRELEQLTPPEGVDLSADDLAFAAGDIALHRRIAATDVRATERGFSTAAAVGRGQARLLLAYQSGFMALSRAVRALAVEAGGRP